MNAQAAKDTATTTIVKPPYMQNRELSWLDFNKRVLDQGADPTVPLLERLNFISIFWSNLQEFFMVRVGSLTDLSLLKKSIIDPKSGMTPAQQLEAIYARCHELYPYYEETYESVRALLADQDIRNLRKEDLTGEQRDYLRWHYWDRFDFADTLFVREADTAQMVEAYARWVALISDRPADAAPMDSLMRRASASRPMLDYFTMLAQQVIHDPNSPLRNDEFYIPVMQAVLASPYYDEYERIGPAYDLAMASQNRLGQRANDFRYTLASGATGTLYGVKAEYTLLFINNPGCGMCKQLREQISGSPMLSEMIERGRLKILALYPDEDLTEWRNYRDHIPASWINAYDAGCLVRENGTYDLTAIPSLYLLDSDKRVLVKDSTDVPYIEEVIDRRG